MPADCSVPVLEPVDWITLAGVFGETVVEVEVFNDKAGGDDGEVDEEGFGLVVGSGTVLSGISG